MKRTDGHFEFLVKKAVNLARDSNIATDFEYSHPRRRGLLTGLLADDEVIDVAVCFKVHAFHANLDIFLVQLKKRFSSKRDILLSLQIFTTSLIVEKSLPDLDLKLKALSALYEKEENSGADIDGDGLISEFESWKKHIQSNSLVVFPDSSEKSGVQQLFGYL